MSSDIPETRREMVGYWIARSKINDPVRYKQYTDRIPAILAKYGGKVLTRGASHEILEGPKYFERFVVLEFESQEAAKRCFESAEYREAAAFRRDGAGEVELTVTGDGDATK